MFSDFFKPPPKPFYTRGDRSNDRPKSAPKKKAKAMDFMDDEEEEEDNASDLEEDDDVEDEEDATKVKSLFEDDEVDEEQGSKSAHEKRLERIKEQIEELEMQNVGVKDWTLGGEVMYLLHESLLIVCFQLTNTLPSPGIWKGSSSQQFIGRKS
jgi:U3 small nucleolar ribonucleoprotein component